MGVPRAHRSTKAPRDLGWDWASRSSRYTNEILEHGRWRSMTAAHAWHEGDGQPKRRAACKLPHHRVIDGKLRAVLSGVNAAMNILAATRFQPSDYRVSLAPEEVAAVYEHLAVHLEQFGEKVPDILKGWTPEDGWPPC